MYDTIKVSLAAPLIRGDSPYVKDQEGNLICQGFSDDICHKRLQLMLDQSNKFLELTAAIEQLAKTHPSLQAELNALLGKPEDANHLVQQHDLAPLAGTYAYSIGDTEQFSGRGRFADPKAAISAAIQSIDERFQGGRTIQFSVARRVHPIEATFWDSAGFTGFGNNIAEAASDICSERINDDEGALSLYFKKSTELGEIALQFLRKNAKVNAYGIADEVSFYHQSTPGLLADELEELTTALSYEYVARAKGWYMSDGQIRREAPNVYDEDDINVEYAKSWQNAVDIDNGLAPTNFESDDDSQRMS